MTRPEQWAAAAAQDNGDAVEPAPLPPEASHLLAINIQLRNKLHAAERRIRELEASQPPQQGR